MKYSLLQKYSHPARPLLFIISLCVFLSVLFSSFKSNTEDHTALVIKDKFIRDVAFLQAEAKQFTTSIKQLQKGIGTLKQSQTAYYCLKSSYKNVEYLLEYLDPELAKSLNGAPLPKVLIEEVNYQTINFQKPSFRTFPPQGLQVLEELLFTDSISQVKIKEAIVQAYALEEKVRLFSNSLKAQPLTYKQILESMREELVRVMTLGITGFDAPVAGREIEYCATALQPVTTTLEIFTTNNSEDSEASARKGLQYLNAAILYLKQHPDFDTFDRLYFIRELLDPAYASLTRLQLQLIPNSNNSLLKPVNDQATSLFSPKYLQAAYYAKQDRLEQRPELINLGKTLFFDPLLSENNKRSCASCHSPNKAFTDGLSRSIAFDFNGTLKRNSPTLLNSIFSTTYFWDSRAQYLQDQVPDVVIKNDELHGNYTEVVRKLRRNLTYKKMFNQAFAGQTDKNLNANTINRAIAAYVQSLVALSSPFDLYIRHETENLSTSAKQGFNLFMGKAGCGTCHFAPIFNGTVPPRYLESESEVLGVPATADLKNLTLDADIGKAGIIPADVFRYSFKTPTVRNAAVTSPYMHNGVFNTLQEVIEFYNEGGGVGLGLEVPHQTLPDNKLNLTQAEKNDLLAFMQALTDTAVVNSKPKALPKFLIKRTFNRRPIGGNY